MTKKIEKKSTQSQSDQKLSALWLCFLMFVLGYLAASWFDVNQLVHWINSNLSNHAPTTKTIKHHSRHLAKVTKLHPKLEFYTLLHENLNFSKEMEKLFGTEL